MSRLLLLLPAFTLAALLSPKGLAQEPPAATPPEAAGTESPEAAATPATPPTPRPLDHEDYDRWNRLSGSTLSADGRWVLYSQQPAKRDADATLVVQSVDEERRFEVLRGSRAQFTRDAKKVVYLVTPDPEAVKKARKDKKKPEEQPKNKLEILDLATGETTTVPRVRSFSLPDENGRWLAYLLEKPLGEDDSERAAEEVNGEKVEEEERTEPASPEEGSGEKASPEKSSEQKAAEEKAPETKATSETGTSKEPEPSSSTPAAKTASEPKPGQEAGAKETSKGQTEEKKGDAPEKDDSVREAPGTTLVLRDLDAGTERRYEHVASYLFDEEARHLVYHHTPASKADDALVRVDPNSGNSSVIASGRGNYQSFLFDEAGQQLAFLSTRDDAESKPPQWSLYLWRAGGGPAVARVQTGKAGIPEGWGVSSSRSPSFSESGARLSFGTRVLPEPEPEEDESEKEDDDEEPEVKLDIWHWQDPLLQPMQLLQANREKSRDYLAVLHLEDDRVVQLGTPEVPDVSIGQDGDGDTAIANVNLPYRMEISWDSPRYHDVWLIDVLTGARDQILTGVQTSASLSPGGHFAYWFDRVEGHWFARSVKSGKVVNLTELLPHSVADRTDDHPYLDGPHGSAGWSSDDLTLLVYDEYDVWATNPAGFWPPICVTDGWGRENQTVLRHVRLDREKDTIEADEPMLLSALDQRTKASGYYVDTIRSNEPPRLKIMVDARLGSLQKAEDAERMICTRQTFREYPDVWACDADFGGMKRLTDANPQQSEYTWGSAELFEWTAADGEPLQGLLYKPDGFDAAKKYPMMVYFYERNSHNLHRYVTPAPGSSSINWAFYVSRGYLLFIPDIPYREGYPGRSAECAVLPGVARLIDTGFVDKDRIGVQGHSWGGYQSAHLVTQTDIFACAESGAPVSNMTSAYGGIRWGSGMSRMFQYEKTQSRIGGTLWEDLPKYLENSPLFHAPKINTPLLILHNDEDGAVPWYQGIEMFVAMRRLGKPCWMFNYNGEAHGLRQRHNQKDWTVRLQQFFDHYLQDAPAPVWLAQGVPAVEKGENLGLDLVEPAVDD